MKIFLKEHVGLVFIQSIQVILFCLIIILSGFRNFYILLYGILISFILLLCYLVFNYHRRRRFYEKLSVQSINLQRLLEKTDDTPIGDAFDQFSKLQYQLF